MINSYRAGYAWTDEILRGVQAVLAEQPFETELWAEYMDVARLGPPAPGEFLRHLRAKYAGKRFDLILTTDDEALNLLLTEGPMGNTPAVFCGVNNLDRSRVGGRPWLTGVFEVYGTGTILDFALKAHRDATHVYIVTDASPSGIAVRADLERDMARRESPQAVYLDGRQLTLDQISAELDQAPAASVVVASGFRVDHAGIHGRRDSFRRITGNRRLPVYSPAQHDVGSGVVGGSANGGFFHGSMAARIAAQILNGKPPASIPYQRDDTNYYLFDRAELDRWGIAESSLPPGSTVLGADSFYARNKFRIWGGAALAGFQMLVIGGLMANIYRRRRAERELHAIVDNSSAVIFVKDPGGRYLLSNREHRRVLGVGASPVGKGDADLMPAPAAAALRANDMKVFAERRPFESEEIVPQEDGDHTYISLKFPLLDRRGEPYAVCGIATDITARIRDAGVLAASEDRYRTFIANATEAIFRIEMGIPVPIDLPVDEILERIHATAYIAECNDAAARIRGYATAAELAGKRLADIRDRFHPMNLETDRRVIQAGFRLTNYETVGKDYQGAPVVLRNNIIGIIEGGLLLRLWGTQQDITEQKKSGEMLVNVAMGIAASTGEAFFRQSVAHLSRAIGGDIAFIGEAVGPNATCVRTVTLFADGVEQPPLEYSLAGTPCENVVGKESCCHPSGVRELFPDDRLLTDMGVDGYAAAPLFDSQGNVLGLICTLFRRPLSDPRQTMLTIQAFAARVAAEMERTRAHRALEALSAHQESIREQERTRIAREVHDELGQRLTGLKFQMAALRNRLTLMLGSDPARDFIVACAEMTVSVDATLHTVRRIATELRPAVLDNFGLAAAIEWQATEFERKTGIPCLCQVHDAGHVPKDVATALFRILQEALTNVARHAGASEVDVRLSDENGMLTLQVRDDGCGLVQRGGANPGSLGLLGMRERARIAGGILRISSNPGEGTTVVAAFPVAVELPA